MKMTDSELELPSRLSLSSTSCRCLEQQQVFQACAENVSGTLTPIDLNLFHHNYRLNSSHNCLDHLPCSSPTEQLCEKHFQLTSLPKFHSHLTLPEINQPNIIPSEIIHLNLLTEENQFLRQQLFLLGQNLSQLKQKLAEQKKKQKSIMKENLTFKKVVQSQKKQLQIICNNLNKSKGSMEKKQFQMEILRLNDKLLNQKEEIEISERKILNLEEGLQQSNKENDRIRRQFRQKEQEIQRILKKLKEVQEELESINEHLGHQHEQKEKLAEELNLQIEKKEQLQNIIEDLRYERHFNSENSRFQIIQSSQTTCKTEYFEQMKQNKIFLTVEEAFEIKKNIQLKESNFCSIIERLEHQLGELSRINQELRLKLEKTNQEQFQI